MSKELLKVSLVIISVNLSACALNPMDHSNNVYSPDMRQYASNTRYQEDHPSLPREQIASTEPVANLANAGGVGRGMDSTDRQKMSRALDNPPGKATHWVNQSTGMSYTVVPTQKIVMNGNPYCRRYNVTATSQGNTTTATTGTACVSSDGSWQSVSGG